MSFDTVKTDGESVMTNLKSVKIWSSFDTPGFNQGDAVENQPHAVENPSGFEIDLANAIFCSQGSAVEWNRLGWSSTDENQETITSEFDEPSYKSDRIYIASIEGRESRRNKWLFASAVEFDAYHYFYSEPNIVDLQTRAVIDSKTGQIIPHFILDVPANQVQDQEYFDSRISEFEKNWQEDQALTPEADCSHLK